MKKTLFCLLLAFLVIFSVSCAKEQEDGRESTQEEKAERYYDTIRSAGLELVKVEVKNVNMWNDYEGNATIVASVPNYTEFFTAALGEKDMTKAIHQAIKREEYTTVDYEGVVPVSVVGGEQIVNSDDTVKKFIEKELIKAINAVMDTEVEE